MKLFGNDYESFIAAKKVGNFEHRSKKFEPSYLLSTATSLWLIGKNSEMTLPPVGVAFQNNRMLLQESLKIALLNWPVDLQIIWLKILDAL